VPLRLCPVHLLRWTGHGDFFNTQPEIPGAQILMKTTGGMANRQIARDLEVAPETVNRHISRLGRHCLLFHSLMMQNSPPVGEVVVDGFESFEFSPYFPIHHLVAVVKDTDFFIYFTDAGHGAGDNGPADGNRGTIGRKAVPDQV